jgi:hypothetical protein
MTKPGRRDAHPAPAGSGRRVPPLVATSWWLLRRPPLLVPVGLALVLTVATSGVLDDGYGLRVLRGAGVLLACAWAFAVDDPGGEVAAASPYPRVERSAVRVLVAGGLLVPSWASCALLVELLAPDVPVLGAGVEALGLAAVGLAVGLGLRAWRDLHQPAHLATLGIVALAFASSALPRWYALQQSQTWGPPWEAAQIRWTAVLLLGLGVAGLALRDPLGRRTTLVPFVRSRRP